MILSYPLPTVSASVQSDLPQPSFSVEAVVVGLTCSCGGPFESSGKPSHLLRISGLLPLRYYFGRSSSCVRLFRCIGWRKRPIEVSLSSAYYFTVPVLAASSLATAVHS
ncbi:hypothetical protein DTO063F5_302 [Paecilomyces variotii]|nr:hypothetical protein DTO063F5_302 [Paecilomyces variotii]KAJ9407142.1 hypothetical protein DTO045G8_4991 [Paecilomyces variotii]